MFHYAGHIISYRDILRIDTALATHTLSTMDKETGAIIPANLVQGRFIHFSADNIDINEGTLDGQNTFQATQYAAWQRGPISVDPLENVSPTQQVTLNVPEEMNIILLVHIREGSVEPNLNDNVCEQWFEQTLSDCPAAIKAVAKDRAFHMKRQAQNPKPGWTSFNEEGSDTNPEISLVGYMPIIPAPAHDINTMNTVVRRIMQVAKSFNQSYAVLTVDQALFPLLMELKWIVPEYKDSLIPRLGGLHISMNFLKVLGQHMQDSGLAEIWVESGLFGPGTVNHVLEGKDYNKGVRGHKITVQALWQLLLQQNLETYTKSDVKEDFEKMCDVLSSDTYNALQSSFIASKKDANPNFQFWWQYTEMVQILLLFTRAQREGKWGLHLYAFQEMLPYFHRYDHTNYARWGSVYLAQMKQLPAEVQEEFDIGNWVVKGSSRRFNQVDPDQAQEWMNGVGKGSGGIIGITKTPSALFRWTLSYSLRTHTAAQTREMYHLEHYDQMVHNESNVSRRLQDHADENNVMELLQKSAVFSDCQQSPFPDMLQNIVTKDIATTEIQESLLNACSLGQEKLITFVKQRLMQPKNGDQHKKLRDPLPKNKPPTFATLHRAGKKGVEKLVTKAKAERNVLQRIITAYDAGREVDLGKILRHELMNVPTAIANSDGYLRSGNKSILSQVLCGDVECPAVVYPTEVHSTLVIDGQAFVMMLGQSSDCNTFGQYASKFVRRVLAFGKNFDRIDTTFDRYRDISIKSTTRKKRARGCTPIRRAIENGSVPLPRNWTNFLALEKNKEDLATFLSDELLAQAPADKIIIVAGGFKEENTAKCNSEMDITALQGYHEEADTRIVLHCVHSSAEFLVVASPDTDVLILLIAHFGKMKCKQLWLRMGTSKKPRHIPIHKVHETLRAQVPNIENILAFHAITGCDTVSYFAGHSKKTSWKTWSSLHF